MPPSASIDFSSVNAYSAEVWLRATANGAEPVYTKEEAALIKRKEVDARRANEDRRMKDAA